MCCFGFLSEEESSSSDGVMDDMGPWERMYIDGGESGEPTLLPQSEIDLLSTNKVLGG